MPSVWFLLISCFFHPQQSIMFTKNDAIKKQLQFATTVNRKASQTTENMLNLKGEGLQQKTFCFQPKADGYISTDSAKLHSWRLEKHWVIFYFDQFPFFFKFQYKVKYWLQCTLPFFISWCSKICETELPYYPTHTSTLF